MNTVVKPKRKYTRRNQVALQERPDLPPLDPLEAARETARQWQEGSHKLARSVDCLREGLETIANAEIDRQTGMVVSTKDLRMLAVSTLDAYSKLTGQNWRRNPLIQSWAGDRSETADG